MNISFGIYARPSSTLWKDIRKGPPLDAVREHLDRVVNFRRHLRDRSQDRGPVTESRSNATAACETYGRRRSRASVGRSGHFRLAVADPNASSLM